MKILRKLKKRVQVEKCIHENIIEITTFGDKERTFKCRDCGKILKKEF